jgi:lipopolysaccharide transport system ATP-binding protein
VALIDFENVSKSFPLKPGQKWFRSYLSGDRSKSRKIQVLDQISLHIRNGSSVALIGRNGAGKSTILSLMAGLLTPTSGTIKVEGRIAALLDLGAGFHHDLTGRENMMVSSALLGMSRYEAKERADQIIAFSGLGEFIDQPIRTYSTGMIMRLAFSVAVAASPEILLVDEVLAVGDAGFQDRCHEKIHELRSAGNIFVCVSHVLERARLCKTGIWIERGSIRASGPVGEVIAEYQEALDSGSIDVMEELEPAECVGEGVGSSRWKRRAR